MCDGYVQPDTNVLNFMKELGALIEKYGIEITAGDEWMGYAECGEDIQIRIESDSKSVPFGKYIDKESLKKRIEKAEEGK